MLLSVDTYSVPIQDDHYIVYELSDHEQVIQAVDLVGLHSSYLSLLRPKLVPISLLIKRPGWQSEHLREVYNDNKRTLLSQKI